MSLPCVQHSAEIYSQALGTMTPLSVETLVAQIKAVQPANESERQMLYQAGRELANRSESAFEAANRVVYSVC